MEGLGDVEADLHSEHMVLWPPKPSGLRADFSGFVCCRLEMCLVSVASWHFSVFQCLKSGFSATRGVLACSNDVFAGVWMPHAWPTLSYIRRGIVLVALGP